jgi:hypothetical protein
VIVKPAILGIFVGVLSAPVVSTAATLRVPSEYATINSGLDAASAGDTVLVAPGTYSDFDTRTLIGPATACAFLKPGVVLKSEAGSSATTLDRQGVETGAPDFTVVGWYSDGAVIEGFRITGNPPEAEAAVVQGPAGNPPLVTFRDCLFEGLVSVTVGALRALYASAALYDCRFIDCQGSSAIVRQSEAHMTVENCVFENCSGTALRCEGDSFVVETMTVRNSIFRNNSSPLSGGAITANEYDGGVVIEGCLFEENDAFLSGGAMNATITGPLTLRDNVFVSNRVEGAAFARGGALYLANNVGAQTVIEGNTFYGSYQSYPDGGSAIRGSDGAILRNNAFSNSSGAPALAASGPGYTEESCNLFWNNAAGDAVGFTPDDTDIFADPEFCNPDAGDFTVSSTSPCAPGNAPPCGQIGALGVGCGLVSIEPTSWGRIKSRFRSAEE